MSVLLAACSGGDDSDADSATTTKPTPVNLQRKIKLENPADEPRPELDVNVMYPEGFTEEQIEVVKALRGYEHATLLAFDPPDPNHPLLPRYAAPDRLAQVQANIRDLVRRNRAIRLPADSRTALFVTKVKLRGAKATVESCSVDDSFYVDLSNQQPIDAGGSTTHWLVDVLMNSPEGGWRVAKSASSTLREWEGVAGCATQYGL